MYIFVNKLQQGFTTTQMAKFVYYCALLHDF